jgi:type 1 glutamine amidotransferase
MEKDCLSVEHVLVHGSEGCRSTRQRRCNAVQTISDFDVPHRFVASSIWELPFGKGKAFGTDMGGVANTIVAARSTPITGHATGWGQHPVQRRLRCNQDQ